LFQVETDPGEHVNLAPTQANVWEQMMKRLVQINGTFFAPDRGLKDPAACMMAVNTYGGFWGPFVDV
jgi:arylsulfatase I/J